tara:strand:- start:1409 stop:2074 length:666 start_codon:yes stop_codon:yes gene_type:complete
MKKHILYSFRRCPFAIRARWAIKLSGIEVEIREIDLKNKPSELIKHSISKTVPLLILESGKVIEESLEIILWALKNSKRDCLNKYFKKSFQREILEIIQENDQIFKYHLDRFKYSSRYDGVKKDFHYSEAYKIINKWNSLLKSSHKNNWIIEDEESIADFCLWPFIRQFKIACDSQKISDYFEEPMTSWFEYFDNHKYIKDVMYKYKIWKPYSKIETFPRN